LWSDTNETRGRGEDGVIIRSTTKVMVVKRRMATLWKEHEELKEQDRENREKSTNKIGKMGWKKREYDE